MAGIIEALKQKFMPQQAAPAAPPQPMPGKPWEQPLMGAPQPPPMQAQPLPPPQPDLGAVGAMPGQPVSPMDEALLQALAKKRFNQKFAGATGNPIPQ